MKPYYFKARVGAASISMPLKDAPNKEFCDHIIDALSNVCPENNTMGISLGGILNTKIGKNVSLGKIMACAGGIAIIYVSGKLVYKLITDKAQDNSNLSSGDKEQQKKDAEVKEWISKKLGLFEATSPTESKLGEGERTEVKYLIDKLVKAGDRLVLASPAGQGKSILATQLGIAIARGVSPEFLPQDTKVCAPQKVILYDGELDDNDISCRYGGNPELSDVIRISGKRFSTVFYFLKDIYERATKESSDLTIILDNLSVYIQDGKPEEAKTLFNGLDSIQGEVSRSGHNLTFIIVSHTTKDTNGIPDLKNIAGSVYITRFAKSVMTLTKEDDVVILTDTKRRYDKNQGSYELQLVEEPYVHFERAEVGEEAKERRQGNSSKYDEDTKREIFNIRNSEQKHDYRRIADRLKEEGVDISHTTVGKLDKEYRYTLGERIFYLHIEGEQFCEIAKKLRLGGLHIDEAKVVELYHQYCEGNGIDPDNP